MKILYIQSAITGPSSVTRTLGDAFVAKLIEQHPTASVVRCDVVADPLPHLTLKGYRT